MRIRVHPISPALPEALLRTSGLEDWKCPAWVLTMGCGSSAVVLSPGRTVYDQ